MTGVPPSLPFLPPPSLSHAHSTPLFSQDLGVSGRVHQHQQQQQQHKSGKADEMRAPLLLLAALCAVRAAADSEPVTLVQEADANPAEESALLQPKVLIAIVARNAAHSLAHHLGCIERLDYPKERIAIWSERHSGVILIIVAVIVMIVIIFRSYDFIACA